MTKKKNGKNSNPSIQPEVCDTDKLMDEDPLPPLASNFTYINHKFEQLIIQVYTRCIPGQIIFSNIDIFSYKLLDSFNFINPLCPKSYLLQNNLLFIFIFFKYSNSCAIYTYSPSFPWGETEKGKRKELTLILKKKSFLR